MPRRYAPRYCSECGTVLPNTSKAYALISGGWAVQHSTGGAHNVMHPDFTGYVLCAVCFEAQRPKNRPRQLLPATCTDCGKTPIKYRKLWRAFTQLPATKSVHDPTFGNMHLCEECWITRMSGEQLELFPNG